ncbi:bifunctional [glutamate--ammonia ligase]-adenylyl-L-tyrosine phosphorylase/[glutamate--ammonia-ligase] adenylyltransferase [Vibrio quintilis]|uniref:Bifunctional glutamine synthetase adenylyltransferase/adenylyl-removing enzyme n=1 Tax=Vibrio quintilis TaxID=1117707 RepID=A0A1M7YU15_9VIBR|nr:bifunctional [glutamate--ammonia ligase]-adenylyl-L-tyrosine phosphorylase/[glutamate--ammonia-ligase] adenylyltransferase [Vibrio quintilis]SHO56113.1 Glutamate-ammonia-ligase adenylyltransferase [Vibrio quintilis]
MQLPSQLKELSDKNYLRLTEKHPEIMAWPEDLLGQLRYVLGLSDFIFDALIRDERLCREFPSIMNEPSRLYKYRERLQSELSSVSEEKAGYQLLRHYRRQEMVYIAWRDFLANWSLQESLAHLSALAEAMIFEVYDWQYQLCCQLWGTPCDSEGKAQPMLIIGMGKLGGAELNFSSDIDLIFTYPENGETQGVRKSLSNAQFFTRLGQRIIKSLDQHTADGFCYRVDMRLRPFGDSGPLVMSFSALEDYYQDQGREWERYAMVKARVMGREMYACYRQLRQMLRPFVFRRYIDFSAIQALRRMKAMIQSEVRRRGLTNNIKLGAGGIREIEFIIQSFQLIRGGREPALRRRGLSETLDAIESLGLLGADEIDHLRNAYRFLRRMENLLQAIADKQTQTLPDEPVCQMRLATALNLDSWESLLKLTEQHMGRVNQVFIHLIGEEDHASDCPVPGVYCELWNMAEHPDVVSEIVAQEFGHSEPDEIKEIICGFRSDLARKTLGPRGREVLNHLMPKVFQAIFTHPDSQFGLPRVLSFLQKIVTRTTYLELLDEYPGALKQLVKLCTASPMISEQLGRYPVLLDELLDPQHLYNPVSLENYKPELRDFLTRIPEDDMEQQMEGLRQFKQICLLRIAAADIAGALPVMKVSDHLTYLAEAIVEAVVQQAWKQLAEKYGEPTHLSQRDGTGFAVIGYGKVGGWELGYNSDLDLVFMHDCPSDVYTDGRKEIDGRQFYLRLAQRIIHIFSVRTASGILYEVDTRLRPSGASGLLVTTVEAFNEYQNQEAWTWEHQALVRTRIIYGDLTLKTAFSAVRHQVLSKVRDESGLKKEVVGMRDKMREHLSAKKAGRFMIKQDPGGITDIEFLAQYLVLRYSAEHPSLTEWSDNVRIFGSLMQSNLLEQDQARILTHAYTTLRDQIHRRNLLNLDADVKDDKLVSERESVIHAWKQWFE